MYFPAWDVARLLAGLVYFLKTYFWIYMNIIMSCLLKKIISMASHVSKKKFVNQKSIGFTRSYCNFIINQIDQNLNCIL